jgi:hypothetical protein
MVSLLLAMLAALAALGIAAYVDRWLWLNGWI